MDLFTTYLQLGIDHIIDSKGYDHILFIIALTILFSFKQWKPLLLLVTAFTIGHSITLALASLKIISLNTEMVEIFITLSIAVTSLLNIIRGGATPSKGGLKLYYFLALFFGFIHGMGFAAYLSSILGKESNIFMPLLGFNVGLELGQLIIVGAMLLIGLILDIVFKIARQKFILIASSMIFGITIPILLEYNWSNLF